MHILKAFCLAFTTYSRIPMVSVYPNRDNMRYLMCFLPFVGVVVSGFMMLWFYICRTLSINQICFSAVAAVLPTLITGGIHADGYIDTNDALSSYGDRQKLLKILSDPHVGAFGVIRAIVYYVLYFGFMNGITTYAGVFVTSAGFVLSRALCALLTALMKPAKNSGMLFELKNAANKTAVIFVSVCFIIACTAAMFFANVYVGVCVFVCQIAAVLYYRHFIVKRIDGITGDTCGYFILLSELLTVIAVVIGFKLVPFLPVI